ncbi:MAG: hypothetical protein AAF235_10795 [Planctomycetota bacterium]
MTRLWAGRAGLLGVAVAVGWFAGVRPVRAALAETRAEAASLGAETGMLREALVGCAVDTEALSAVLEDREASYRSWWGSGRSDATSVDSISDVASRYGVTVERYEPIGVARRSRGGGGSAAAVASASAMLRGSWEGVIRTIGALPDAGPGVRVAKFRIGSDASGVVCELVVEQPAAEGILAALRPAGGAASESKSGNGS